MTITLDLDESFRNQYPDLKKVHSTLSYGQSIAILFIVPIVLFIASGLLDVIFIHSLETFDLVNKGLVMKFSTILYTIAAIIGLPVLVIQHFTSNKIKIKNIIAGVLLGIPNVLSIVFFLRCLNHYPESSFVFPINLFVSCSVSITVPMW